MDKQQILAEIKRVASSNGGKPPGFQRFENETGISKSQWYPHVWLRWGDALMAAGFEANQLRTKLDSDLVLGKYAALVRDLGRVPVVGELKVKARNDRTFPSHSVFSKNFGGKSACWRLCGAGVNAITLPMSRPYCQRRPIRHSPANREKQSQGKSQLATSTS